MSDPRGVVVCIGGCLVGRTGLPTLQPPSSAQARVHEQRQSSVLLGHDHDGIRDDVRALVVEHLGDPGAVLVVDETRDLKKGRPARGCAAWISTRSRRWRSWYR